MKGWILVVTITIMVIIDVVLAKQDYSPNLRVSSQENQISVGDQSNKPADVLITKRIREELMKDELLSSRAKNIKIITINSGITLKGVVENSDERERVLKHAYLTAPRHKIYNQISVVR